MAMCVGIAVFMAYFGAEEAAGAGAVIIVVESQGQGLDEGDAFSCWGNLLVCCAGEGIGQLGVSLLYWRAGYAWDGWQGLI